MYTIVKLPSFYDEFVGDESTTRTRDFKNKLQKHFYVLSANDELVSNSMHSSILGERITKAARIKTRFAKSVMK